MTVREEWLMRAAELLQEKYDLVIPGKYRVACGFPRGSKAAIGQCWSKVCSGDESTEMFISPFLESPVEVLATLLHEIIHAVVGIDKKHGKVFKTEALRVGLEGRMTSTYAGSALAEQLTEHAETLGEYPHSALKNGEKKARKERDNTTYTCPACGYTVQIAKKYAESGLPTCPCGEEFVSGV